MEGMEKKTLGLSNETFMSQSQCLCGDFCKEVEEGWTDSKLVTSCYILDNHNSMSVSELHEV